MPRGLKRWCFWMENVNQFERRRNDKRGLLLVLYEKEKKYNKMGRKRRQKNKLL